MSHPTAEHKLIISSKVLSSLLSTARSLDLVCVAINGCQARLSMGDDEFPCDCTTAFTHTISLVQCTRLLAIMRRIEHQPVTLVFRENDAYVGLQSIVL